MLMTGHARVRALYSHGYFNGKNEIWNKFVQMLLLFALFLFGNSDFANMN